MKSTLYRILGIALVAFSATAAAQQFPTKRVTFVSGVTPGSASDTMARILAEKLQAKWGQPVIVENKLGAGGMVGAKYVAQSEPDGHLIMMYASAFTVSPLLQPDLLKPSELQAVATVATIPTVLVSQPEKYKTLKDFIAAAKQKPGELKQSGGSITSRDNVVRQLLQQETGARWAYISFPGGGERIAALLGGHVEMMVIEPEEAGQHIRAGNMRVLAQVTEKRLAAFPDVPTLKEAGFDVPVVPQVRGVVAPPGIPADEVAYWEEAFRKLTQTASWKKFLADNQFEDGYQNAAELTKFYDTFTVQMRGILKEAGIKVVR